MTTDDLRGVSSNRRPAQCASWSHRYSVAIMVDTEGSEVHTNELKEPIKAEVGCCTGPTCCA